LTTWNNWSYT